MKKAAPKNRVSQDKPGTTSREAILGAALSLFARDGFEGTSLLRIAEAAKVGHPLIHYYFGSKDALWKATIDHALQDMRRQASTLSSASKGLRALDRLRVLMRALSLFAVKCPDHFGLVVSEARAKSTRWDWLQKHYGSGFLGDLEAILAEAQAAGEIRAMALDQVTFILVGSVLVYFSVNPFLPETEDVETLADQFTDVLMDVVLNGLSVKKSG